MKTLLIAEYRAGKLLESYTELVGFAQALNAESAMFVVGSTGVLPHFNGTCYVASAETCGEYNPAVHKRLVLEVIEKEQPDVIVFHHSSYGWDLAPRLAAALGVAQISEVMDLQESLPVVPVCNAKLRRTVRPSTKRYIVTLQPGAFNGSESDTTPEIVAMEDGDGSGTIVFEGYEQPEKTAVDLSRAEIIVSAGRGIGKQENVQMVAELAERLGGEYGASRPVVDALWVEHSRQVGTTGQSVTPKLYIACGISGAIQHLAGMKKSEFVVAVNTDRDAPIGEVADVLVVSDLKQFVPALLERLS